MLKVPTEFISENSKPTTMELGNAPVESMKLPRTVSTNFSKQRFVSVFLIRFINCSQSFNEGRMRIMVGGIPRICVHSREVFLLKSN